MNITEDLLWHLKVTSQPNVKLGQDAACAYTEREATGTCFICCQIYFPSFTKNTHLLKCMCCTCGLPWKKHLDEILTLPWFVGTPRTTQVSMKTNTMWPWKHASRRVRRGRKMGWDGFWWALSLNIIHTILPLTMLNTDCSKLSCTFSESLMLINVLTIVFIAFTARLTLWLGVDNHRLDGYSSQLL